MSTLRATLATLASLATLLLGEAAAHGYPQWQFSSGTTRCGACHFSPTGGGLLSSYGRDEAGEDLSTFGGDGAFIHGAARLPKWLAIGGDLRGAFVVNDVQDPGGPSHAFFPMQVDLSARLALPAGISLSGTVGARGQVRSSGDLIPDQNFQPVTDSQLVSREHFVMWRPAPAGAYVKIGRFYAPFGLRLAEHILYIRRDLGFNLMEESYNVSGGYVGERSELHVTAFAPDLLRHMGGTESGGAATYEHHVLDDTGAVGAQAKVAFGDGVTRWIAGTVGKAYVAGLHTLFLGEVDFVHNDFSAMGVGSTDQLVGLVGASVFPARGTVVTLYGERDQTDLRLGNSAWDAGDLLVSWFPIAHVELQVMGRVQFPSGGDSTKTLLAQLHYFL